MDVIHSHARHLLKEISRFTARKRGVWVWRWSKQTTLQDSRIPTTTPTTFELLPRATSTWMRKENTAMSMNTLSSELVHSKWYHRAARTRWVQQGLSRTGWELLLQRAQLQRRSRIRHGTREELAFRSIRRDSSIWLSSFLPKSQATANFQI